MHIKKSTVEKLSHTINGQQQNPIKKVVRFLNLLKKIYRGFLYKIYSFSHANYYLEDR